jgi:toxin ParE1/3/4
LEEVRSMKLRYRRRAQLDIENIYDYIEERNPRAAAEVVARIRSAAERLGMQPYLGHVGRSKGTYEWVVVGLPYVIVYEIDEVANEVAIIAVFHGAQNRDRRSR